MNVDVNHHKTDISYFDVNTEKLARKLAKFTNAFKLL